jgi:hypothetical protein
MKILFAAFAQAELDTLVRMLGYSLCVLRVQETETCEWVADAVELVEILTLEPCFSARVERHSA